ncbi:MAG TPA: helix-turn-helix domain-containing protein [Acidimicrobiia bacterium]|nr:helix-turn-helix domain-containing protein [Acidimicrobiia bacterium]
MSNSTRSISDWETRTVLSIEEVALILGLGRSATYESARRGELPTLRLGRRVLVPVAAFSKWLEQAS